MIYSVVLNCVFKRKRNFEKAMNLRQSHVRMKSSSTRVLRHALVLPPDARKAPVCTSSVPCCDQALRELPTWFLDQESLRIPFCCVSSWTTSLWLWFLAISRAWFPTWKCNQKHTAPIHMHVALAYTCSTRKNNPFKQLQRLRWILHQWRVQVQHRELHAPSKSQEQHNTLFSSPCLVMVRRVETRTQLWNALVPGT